MIAGQVCPVCYESDGDWHPLPCGHGMCIRCMNNVCFHENMSPRCPMCRKFVPALDSACDKVARRKMTEQSVIARILHLRDNILESSLNLHLSTIRSAASAIRDHAIRDHAIRDHATGSSLTGSSLTGSSLTGSSLTVSLTDTVGKLRMYCQSRRIPGFNLARTRNDLINLMRRRGVVFRAR